MLLFLTLRTPVVDKLPRLAQLLQVSATNCGQLRLRDFQFALPRRQADGRVDSVRRTVTERELMVKRTANLKVVRENVEHAREALLGVVVVFLRQFARQLARRETRLERRATDEWRWRSLSVSFSISSCRCR